MEPRQIFIVHDSIWKAMEDFAQRHDFHLSRIPDGEEDGRPFFSDDPETTPTYAFMPKSI